MKYKFVGGLGVRSLYASGWQESLRGGASMKELVEAWIKGLWLLIG